MFDHSSATIRQLGGSDFMTANAWFRNSRWNEDIAGVFEQRLKRARRKGQYLRIQASSLANTEPKVALQLLDRYFALGDDFDLAQGHVDRARAFLALGEQELAFESFECALEREREFPKMQTLAPLEFPYLIAIHGVRGRFEQALSILASIDLQLMLMFPIDRFKYHAAKALILVGSDPSAAKAAGLKALEAAGADHSGFRYHPSVGLVRDGQTQVISRLLSICEDESFREGRQA